MSVFTYEARTSLGASHVVGQTYTIEIRLEACDEVQEIYREDQRSLSLKTEVQFFGAKRSWTCSTVPIVFGQQQYVIEFLDSVMDGSLFTADLHGSLRRPDVGISVIRVDSESQRFRRARLGNGGREDYRGYQFTVREP